MTTLNHERWQLKLIDDAKRQNAATIGVDRHTMTLNRFDWYGIDITATQKVAEQLDAFAMLEAAQRDLAACAFQNYADYRKAKSRTSKDVSETPEWDVFVGSAAKLLHSLIADLEADRSGFWQWYVGFHKSLTDKERRIFAEFGFGLLKSRLSIWLARDFAASPPRAKFLLTMLN